MYGSTKLLRGKDDLMNAIPTNDQFNTLKLGGLEQTACLSSRENMMNVKETMITDRD